MNRLTAIGLASLVAYGLLIASKYTGVVSAAREDRTPQIAAIDFGQGSVSGVQALKPEPRQATLQFPAPVARIEPSKLTAVALDFRASRDLKAFVDSMASRRASLSGDERYHLAKALEECQFATTINEDLATYSAKKKREFLASLPPGDPNSQKRIAAYEAVDNTQRCIGFQNAKISPNDIDELYRAAAMQGDPRAQARILTAELSKTNSGKGADTVTVRAPAGATDLIGLLQTHEPEALIIVGDYLSGQSSALRVGPAGIETPEASALLGAFSLVACDLGQDCTSMHRDLLQACAYSGHCNVDNFEALYQNFMASPYSYTTAQRYRAMIHDALTTQNWALIGLTPPAPATQGQ